MTIAQPRPLHPAEMRPDLSPEAWAPPISTLAERVLDRLGHAHDPVDVQAARRIFEGRRVLVTGAGGSIGSELTRQVRDLGPSSVLMLDRDESALQELQLGLEGHGLLDSAETVLADIRDPRAVDAVFAEHRPEVVLHAAALKHLPLLQRYPREAWLTNVHGTRIVLDAALRHGTTHLVNISTDKAADPTCVLGGSKRLAEGLTAHAASRSGKAFVSVRFGNVIGSRGSVLPTFVEQVRRGGPLTITHPDVTRYLMTIPQACSLVLCALAVGESGQTLVLDMGEPVRVADIATTVAELAGVTCPIVYTGLRPGEKLHEDLLSARETIGGTAQDGIHRVRCTVVDPAGLPGAEEWTDAVRSILLANSTVVPAPPRTLEGMMAS
ncbi:polysaccharide biosynthesis protein [Brachybacterium phenoliresistens]|uniref:polysaccharide biosynthesis protein n=1 Tax=Brachybacterium phenoliresistens TaxID=396014 RepID=UPI0031D9FD14